MRNVTIDSDKIRPANEDSMNDIVKKVQIEVERARANWPVWNSAHEGYGVVTEEYKELEEHVFVNQKKRNIEGMKTEAIQLAAMAIRFAFEVCTEERGRR